MSRPVFLLWMEERYEDSGPASVQGVFLTGEAARASAERDEGETLVWTPADDLWGTDVCASAGRRSYRISPTTLYDDEPVPGGGGVSMRAPLNPPRRAAVKAPLEEAQPDARGFCTCGQRMFRDIALLRRALRHTACNGKVACYLSEGDARHAATRWAVTIPVCAHHEKAAHETILAAEYMDDADE